jgi:hypothetical protein
MHSADHATGEDIWLAWDPLEDDGDNFRLDVLLNLRPEQNFFAKYATCYGNGLSVKVAHNEDPYRATRRAVVHAAADSRTRLPGF